VARGTKLFEFVREIPEREAKVYTHRRGKALQYLDLEMPASRRHTVQTFLDL